MQSTFGHAGAGILGRPTRSYHHMLACQRTRHALALRRSTACALRRSQALRPARLGVPFASVPASSTGSTGESVPQRSASLGTNDAVLKQLDLLNAEDKEVAAQLVKTRDAWLADRKDAALKAMYNDLTARQARLEEQVRALEPTLAGGQSSRPAPRGPVRFNLDSEAPELAAPAETSSTSPILYDMKRPGLSDDVKDFYIDHGGTVIRDVDAWLYRCFASIQGCKVEHSPPMFINGLTKVGKSCVLNDILPARLRVHPQFGVNKPQEVLLFKLRMDTLLLTKGYAAMLRSFLIIVMGWLERLDVPIEARVWQAAVRALPPDSAAEELQVTIMLLLQAVQVPCVMLLDEVQSFYMPVENDALDVSGAAAARGLFKSMVTNSPRTMLWAVTGSSMATFWVNLAMTAPHGVSLLVQSRLINLPPTQDTLAIQCCWRALGEKYPVLNDAPELYKLAQDTTPAMLVCLVRDWVEQGCPADILGYVSGRHLDKLLNEASRDWHYALQFLDKAQSVHMHNLASVTVGLNMGLLDRGLVRMLTPFTRPVRPGSSQMCLNSALHCELILSLITPDGELKKPLDGLSVVGSLEVLQAQRLQLLLGNAAVAARNDKWSDDWKLLKEDLQMLGESLELKGVPLSEWPKQAWFMRVRHSPYNKKAAATWVSRWKQHEEGECTLELWEVVAMYSIMVRNCLGHEEYGEEAIWDFTGKLPGVFDLENVEIATSWPFAETVGRIPAAVGPIASRVRAVQIQRSSSGGGYSGSAGGAASGSSQGRGGSTVVSPLRLQEWPSPFCLLCAG